MGVESKRAGAHTPTALGSTSLMRPRAVKPFARSPPAVKSARPQRCAHGWQTGRTVATTTRSCSRSSRAVLLPARSLNHSIRVDAPPGCMHYTSRLFDCQALLARSWDSEIRRVPRTRGARSSALLVSEALPGWVGDTPRCLKTAVAGRRSPERALPESSAVLLAPRAGLRNASEASDSLSRNLSVVKAEPAVFQASPTDSVCTSRVSRSTTRIAWLFVSAT